MPAIEKNPGEAPRPVKPWMGPGAIPRAVKRSWSSEGRGSCLFELSPAVAGGRECGTLRAAGFGGDGVPELRLARTAVCRQFAGQTPVAAVSPAITRGPAVTGS